MKRIFIISFGIALVSLAGCKGNDSKVASVSATASATETKSTGDTYFDFTVDGKELHVNAEDITSSYYPSSKKNVFKIFAGKEGEPTILLTIPQDMTKGSSTPNGSPDFDMQITQGSVSLQNYPEKNYTTNSFNTIYPEMSVPTADAVVITGSEKDGDKARIITGTFNTTTYGEKDGKDPKDGNHKVIGKFKIRHEFSSMNGGPF